MEVLVTQQAGVINCDFDSAKRYLSEQLEIYRGMVFTEDSKKEAKSTIADLRKQKSAFSDRVKEVKKEYMKPFEEFQAKANELIALYDEPILFINDQVSEFERKRIEEKKERIEKIYDEFMGDMKEILPLTKVYNPKWENSTFTEKKIKDEMVTTRLTVIQGLEAIRQMNSDVEETAIQMFLQDYDITKAILYINNHERQKAEILAREQERIKKEEEERIRREERRRIEEEQRHKKEIELAKEEAEQEVISSYIPDGDDSDQTKYVYHITLTPDAKNKLEMFMDSVGIEYELIF